jgi:uncharacterized protein (DUF1330 family)
MSAYVIFDVEIRDMNKYQEFMKAVKPPEGRRGLRLDHICRGRLATVRYRKGSCRLIRLSKPCSRP